MEHTTEWPELTQLNHIEESCWESKYCELSSQREIFFPFFLVFFIVSVYEKLDVSWTYCGNHYRL